MKVRVVYSWWVWLLTGIFLVPTGIVFVLARALLTANEMIVIGLMTLLGGGKMGRSYLRYCSLQLVQAMTSRKATPKPTKAQAPTTHAQS